MVHDKDGRFWPTDKDRTPGVERFNVPISPLTSDVHIPGSNEIKIIETDRLVEERLRHQFALYRAVKFFFRVAKIN